MPQTQQMIQTAADAADTSDTQTLSRAHIEKHDVPLVSSFIQCGSCDSLSDVIQDR